MAITSTRTKTFYNGEPNSTSVYTWTITYADEAGDTTNQAAMDAIDLEFGGKYKRPLRLEVEFKRTDGNGTAIDGVSMVGSNIDPSLDADDTITANVTVDDMAGIATSTFDLTGSATQNWTSGPVEYTNGLPRYVAAAIDSIGEIVNMTIVIRAIYK